MTEPDPVHVVVPGDVDDVTAPSGGNTYDLRICRDLADGRTVRRAAVRGDWPHPDEAALARLDRLLWSVPDGRVVLLDGLVACAAPDVVVPHAKRLRAVVIVHLPLAAETGLAAGTAAELHVREGRTLQAAAAVVATGPAAARDLVEAHGLDPGRVHVAEPGTDPAPLTPRGANGSRLLCVASVTPRKAQDVLLGALATLTDLDWTCELVGSLTRDQAYAAVVLELAAAFGGRVKQSGPLTGADLDAAYARADLLVLLSWGETYGMVVTEALARGIPVLASDAGALPDTLGEAPGGGVPGLLVPAGDLEATSAALRRWLSDEVLRRRLRNHALARRATLEPWTETARRLAAVLDGLAP